MSKEHWQKCVVELLGYSKKHVFFRIPTPAAHRIATLPRAFLKRGWTKVQFFNARVNPWSWKSYDYGYYVDLELMSVIEERAVDAAGGSDPS